MLSCCTILSFARLTCKRFHRDSRLFSQQTLTGLLNSGHFLQVLPSGSEKYLKQLTQGSVYIGIDPSAESLQLGNLVAIIGLLRCHIAGHNIIAVIGTGTVPIGDPSGRLAKRSLLSHNQYVANADRIESELRTIFRNYDTQFCRHSRDSTSFQILRNDEWLKKANCIHFIEDITSNFRVPELLAKESVKLRLNSGNGMDLSEFLYPVLQATDFLHLYQHHNCRVQIGGHDQLGNISCGLQLIQRKLGKHAFGLTVPLLTTPDGVKFGKSTSSAGVKQIWLSREKLLPLEFYQAVLNLPDTLVSAQLLKQLTFLTLPEIETLMQRNAECPGHRPVQRCIARELTLLVHGADGLQSAELATRIFYPPDKSSVRQLNDHLTSTERDYLRACLQPTAHLLPVIHAKAPDHRVGRWLQHVFNMIDPDATSLLRRGIILNDVVLSEPSRRQHQSDGGSDLFDSIPSTTITDALKRVDPNYGVNILKIGRHDHWFLVLDENPPSS